MTKTQEMISTLTPVHYSSPTLFCCASTLTFVWLSILLSTIIIRHTFKSNFMPPIFRLLFRHQNNKTHHLPDSWQLESDNARFTLEPTGPRLARKTQKWNQEPKNIY